MGLPLLSCFFLEQDTITAMVVGILTMGTSSCEDDEEVGHDQNETGIATFSLVRAPFVLVGHL